MSGQLSDWLPSLPAGWGLKPFYTLMRERSRPNVGLTEKNLLSLSYGKIVEKDIGSNSGLLPASFEGYNIVEPNDIVLRLTDLQNDQRSLRTGQVRKQGIITSAYVTVIPDDALQPHFAQYLLHGYDLAKLFYRMGGGLRQSMKFSDLKNLPLVLPPPGAQERIANFLDDKTARIDALIAEKERLVESLVEFEYSNSSRLMTRGLDSSVSTVLSSHPEIGLVPTHWKVTPLKFLGEVRSGVAKGKDNGNKDTVSLPYLRVANVQDGYVDLTEVSTIEVSASDAGRYLLQKGDVLMNEGGDNDKLGRGAVWQAQVDPCIHQNHVFAVRLNDVELSDWVSAFTSTDAARTYFYLRSKQSTNLASINQSNVRELPVPMPPENERKSIMNELKRSTTATNDLIEHVVEHIARLREYRSSLISAAVTGQLDKNNFKEVK